MESVAEVPDLWNMQSVSSDLSNTIDRDEKQDLPSNNSSFVDVNLSPELSTNSAHFCDSNLYTENKTTTNTNNQSESNVSSNNRHGNVFDNLSLAFRNFFRWRRGGFGAPKITPESGSKFFSPETRGTIRNKSEEESNQKNNTITMETLKKKEQYGTDENQQASNTYRSEYDSDYFRNNELEEGHYYRSYPSKIYSVNSAGNPVPITIEETIQDNETFSEDEKSQYSSEDGSKVNLHPSLPQFRCCSYKPKEFVLKIWRKTYISDSLFMFYWLMLVTLTVLYNLWVIPLRASFIEDIQTPWQNIWFAFDAISDVIYVVDIFIKFRTQYMKCGIYIDKRSALIKYHKKEWTVLLDFISVFPTDLFFIKSINPYYRMNRAVRLYRSYKFYCILELKTSWPNVLRVANLVNVVVLLLHYNACIYYAASLNNGYGLTLSSWAYPNPLLYPDYATLTRRYTYSFYWSLQQLSLLGGRPLPEESWQFAFTIYLNIAGIALIVYLIGYVTTLLMGKYSKKFEFENTMETTRRFMKRRKLPKDLRLRVERFYDYMWKKSEYSHLDENQLLRHLPISVKQEIIYHGNFNALRKLPELSNCDSNILRSLVSKLQRRTYLPGQFVYRSGDAGTEMFIVGDGLLQIIRERDGHVSSANAGDIFGEMNIFDLNKNHRRSSDIVSCGYSELFVLTAKDANETLAQFPRVMNLVMQQAKRNRAMVRRKMSANFYKRHYQDKPLLSDKFTDSPYSIQTSSNVHLSINGDSANSRQTLAQHNHNSFLRFNTQGGSPDSGIPPSPARRQISETKVGENSHIPTENMGMIVRPEMAEKLTHIYQKNLKSLQTSLDDVWINEVAILKQQLVETETERDKKAKEINQLRSHLSKENKSTLPIQTDLQLQKNTTKMKEKPFSVTNDNLSNDEEQVDILKPANAEINAKPTVESRRKITSKHNTKRMRTIMPSVISTSSV